MGHADWVKAGVENVFVDDFPPREEGVFRKPAGDFNKVGFEVTEHLAVLSDGRHPRRGPVGVPLKYDTDPVTRAASYGDVRSGVVKSAPDSWMDHGPSAHNKRARYESSFAVSIRPWNDGTLIMV